MNTKNKHINISHSKIPGILLKTVMVFGLIVMFIQSGTLKAQVLNNNGAAISVTNGAAVQGDTLENTAGTIQNNGIIQLNGHYINIGTTQGDGIYNLKGNWTNTGTFTSGNSIVRFNGNSFQLVQSNGDAFFHVIVNNSGTGATNRLILSDNITVSDSLDLITGNIQTNANLLYLEDPTPASLTYSSVTGSRIIGKFERGVGITDNYLFPVGSDDHYNPMNLTFNNVSAGSVLSEFVNSDPDSIGLPLPDPGYVNPTDSVEVYDADSVGYWSVTAKGGFASTDFDVNLKGSGFSEVQNASRIIKRPDGGDWTLDGDHKDGIDSVAYRNTLIGGIDNSPGHHFGWGHIRPRIQKQPEDTAICDGESATFSIVATGRGELSYEWQVLENSGGWRIIDISDNATYDNYDTDTLLIIAADTSMDGYKYRVIVTDSLGNFHRSNSQATLTVSPRPVVTATPQKDTICNGGTTFIELNSTVPGTTFEVDTLYAGNIQGANSNLVGDTIMDTLINPTLYADSVVYRIFPTGPTYPYCGGTADTVVIWVEPTVVINALDDTLCNGDYTDIDIRSENVTTNGIKYTWTSSATDADVSGYTNNVVGQDTLINITDQLINVGLDSAIVHYIITPWTLDASGNLKCSGTPLNIDIWVEPTVNINAANDTLCDGDATNITVTSPNTTTNGIRYTWTYVDNPDVTGETASVGNGQNIGSAIVQNLTNTSYTKQLVQYTITPWTVNANNENECTDAAEVITVDIWIDPTPRVFSSIARDTICNDTRTSITLTTPNVLTQGEVTFDYVSAPDPFLTGNTTGNGLTDSYVIDDSLHNSTSSPAYPQVVRYTITPRALSISCADGPAITDSITVHPTPDTDMSSDSVKCYLESNGTATVLAENGINIFTYEWDDPSNQTTATATGLIEDDYTVTVTDNQGCIKVDSIHVGQPDLLVPFIDTVKNVSCNGKSDGYIILDPYGGNGQYNYFWWKTGETTDSIGGLYGDFWDVTVGDWKGCDTTITILVNEPPQTTMDVLVDHVSCNGANDGRLEADVAGFSNYEWSTGATTAVISNLSAGFYSVTATNTEGCLASQIKEVKEPEPIVIDTIRPEPISCAGDADGTISLEISGGNIKNFYTGVPIPDPYNFNWSTSDGTGLVDTIQNQSGLSGGTYYVTVSDGRGCSTNDSATVNEPPEFYSTLSASDVTCFGDNNGEIDLQVFGGNTNSTYTYNWITSDGEGLVEDSEDQTSLTQGTYYVTIYDTKNCEIFDTAVINEPPLLEATVSETNINCFGYNDGTAVVDITGGTPNYTIEWSNGSSQDSIYNLAAGNYNVTVTDAHGCDTVNNFQLSEPEEIINSVDFENITCFGYANGKIVITPVGGTIPYNYVWSDASINNDSIAENLGPGEYTISVVDDNNCEEISKIELTQPDPLIADIDKSDITCHGEGDGYIVLTMFGGTPEYTYTWSNGFSEPSANMLPEGEYSISVTDIHNCQIDTSIYIEEPDELAINPTVIRPTCPDIQNGSIELNINGGRTPYTIYWDNGSFDDYLTDIRSGIYDVLITDSSLCELDTSFVVRSAHDFCIDIPTAFSPNGDNINEKWVIDMQGLYPSVEVEIFDRWGKRVFYSKGYEESQYWDGTYNGKELPMDNYYYIIYLKNGSKRISGSITLLR